MCLHSVACVVQYQTSGDNSCTQFFEWLEVDPRTVSTRSLSHQGLQTTMASKIKSRNKLLSSHKKSLLTKSSVKDELVAMKYVMDRPGLPVYAFEDLSKDDIPPMKQTEEVMAEANELTYPDFIPWKDHTQVRKEEVKSNESDDRTYLSKGYFEAPQVGNEYYSGRNLVLATLFQSNENCLNVVSELSRYLANAYTSRNENINKIRHNAGHFKIPQKVTLTATKRESWLNDLSNPNIPLKKIGEKIPHGIRSKLLIDALCTRATPINRALWFTKCVLFSELLTLRRKHQSKILDSNLPEKFELHWLQEWTQQIVGYMVKMSQDIGHIDGAVAKEYYIKKLGYLREFILSLYAETLLDKQYFLSLILKPLGDGFPIDSDTVSHLLSIRQMEDTEDYDVSIQEDLGFTIDYGQRFAALVWVKTFWNDIIGCDYLAKELSELLLLNYFYTTKLSRYPKWFLPEHLRNNLTRSLHDLVIYLFKRNTNNFVIPGNWVLTGDALVSIVSQEMGNVQLNELKKLADQLELINYRNESLIINSNQVETDMNFSSESQVAGKSINGDAKNFRDDRKYCGQQSSSKSPNILEQLDHLRFNEKLAQKILPQMGNQSNDKWKQNLHTIFFWSVSPWRHSAFQNENLSIVCNFLRKSVFSQAEKSVKMEFENEILECIFASLESDSELVDNRKLYIMINELYQLKLITIGSYLRKLIASGVFYTTTDDSKSQKGPNESTQNHLQCLTNLPVLNNKQCDSILRKWNTEGLDFKGTFEKMKKQLQSEILETLFTNKGIIPSDHFEKQWSSIQIGLKFLLVNWFTDEFKTRLVNSPKLVVFTQDILADLYKFYSISDNLPVFFKIIVPTILRNESRMAILYLDGLYFISKLIMRHFKLLKQFVDTSNKSTIANIFRLIMQNYKDLSQRESVAYNFHQVWSFVDSITEKDGTSSRKRKWGDAVSDPENFGIPTYRKDNLETPMQIQSVDLALDHTPKLTDNYSSDDFKNDLAALRVLNSVLLKSESEVNGLKAIAGNTNIDNHLSYWYLKVDCISESEETAIVRLWRHFAAGIAVDVVEKTISSAVSDVLHSACQTNLKILMIKKLVIYDIISLKGVVSLLTNNGKEQLQLLLLQMLLEPDFPNNMALSAAKYQLYRISVYFFKEKNKKQYTCLILQGLTARNLHSCLLDNKEEVKHFLSHSLVTEGRHILSELLVNTSRDDCFDLLNLCLNKSKEDYVGSLSKFEQSIDEINEFNKPFYQALLSILSFSLNVEDKSSATARWEVFIETYLNRTRSEGSSKNLLFGSLFCWVPWQHKLIILEILENKVFTQPLDDTTTVTLTMNGAAINSIAVGFLDTFLSSTVNAVSSPNPFITKFTEFLSRVNTTINRIIIEERHDSLDTLLSIILKLLIIHMLTLCAFIAKNLGDELAENMVKRLILIVDSKYLERQNLKLRVLFHDLLLVMKTSVNDEITTLAGEMLPISNGLQEQQPSPEEARHKEANVIELIATTSQVQHLFAIPQFDDENPFKNTLDDSLVKCAIMLSSDELAFGGDANYINGSNFKLEVSKTDSLNIPSFMGNILSNEKNNRREGSHSRTCVHPFRIRTYELLEDTSHSLNDGCVNLLLFDGYVARENPP